MLPVSKKNLELFLLQHPIPSIFQTYLKEFPIPDSLKLLQQNSQNLFKIVLKINALKQEKKGQSQRQQLQTNFKWKKWQLGLFVWVIIYYCFVMKISINQLNQQSYLFLQSIFQQKSVYKLQHQIFCLCSSLFEVKAQWSQEQDDHLKEIVHERLNEKKSLDWKFISFCIYSSSNGLYYKSYSQCRQRWNNHFDPKISKESWTKFQDLILLRNVEEIGKKWSNIAKIFKGKRTEHMVKNRYNALVKKIRQNNSDLSEIKIQKRLINQIQRAINLQEQRSAQKNQLNVEEKSEKIEMESEAENVFVKMEEESFSFEPQMATSLSQSSQNFTAKLPSLLPIVENVDNDKKFKELFEFDYEGIGNISYDDKALRPIIDDVVEKVGCGHAELLTMYLQSQNSSWNFDSNSIL